MKRIIPFVIVAAVVVACSHKTLMGPTQADADYAAKKWPGTTLADLSQGKTIYEQNCNKCHGLKDPNSLNEAGWDKILVPMAKKAQLDDHSKDLVLKYLVSVDKNR
jgi:cytochrome c5